MLIDLLGGCCYITVKLKNLRTELNSLEGLTKESDSLVG